MEIAFWVAAALAFVAVGILAGYYLNVVPLTLLSIVGPFGSFMLYQTIHQPHSMEEGFAIALMAIVFAWLSMLFIIPMWLTTVVARIRAAKHPHAADVPAPGKLRALLLRHR